MRPKFTIAGLILLTLVAGVIFAVLAFVAQNARGVSQREIGEGFLWGITLGAFLGIFLVLMFARDRDARLLLIGLTVAFAAFGYGIFLRSYLGQDSPGELTGGLMNVALILVMGAVASTLLAQWRERIGGRPEHTAPSDHRETPRMGTTPPPLEDRPS